MTDTPSAYHRKLAEIAVKETANALSVNDCDGWELSLAEKNVAAVLAAEGVVDPEAGKNQISRNALEQQLARSKARNEELAGELAALRSKVANTNPVPTDTELVNATAERAAVIVEERYKLHGDAKVVAGHLAAAIRAGIKA